MTSRRGLPVARQETLEVEQGEDQMVCTRCGENILGKAMKVSSALMLHHLFKVFSSDLIPLSLPVVYKTFCPPGG